MLMDSKPKLEKGKVTTRLYKTVCSMSVMIRPCICRMLRWIASILSAGSWCMPERRFNSEGFRRIEILGSWSTRGKIGNLLWSKLPCLRRICVYKGQFYACWNGMSDSGLYGLCSASTKNIFAHHYS